jgi:hypothetical protein
MLFTALTQATPGGCPDLAMAMPEKNVGLHH